LRVREFFRNFVGMKRFLIAMAFVLGAGEALPQTNSIPATKLIPASDLMPATSLALATNLIPAPAEYAIGSGTVARDRLARKAKVRISRKALMRHLEGKHLADWQVKSAYLLELTKKGARIVAADEEGAFYAQQTLKMMASLDGEVLCCTILDWPRFRYRGVMLDESRHYQGKAFVEKQLEMMALLKMNRFHFHLVDNPGWRVQIDAYPRLTNLTAWRPTAFFWDWEKNAIGGPFVEEGTAGAYGGYYTKADIAEVLAFADERHIEVIPEIEMPGHNYETRYAFPELACSLPGGGKDPWELCPGKESTFRFLETVLLEIFEMFPSKYIHIGGDEAFKDAWRACPKCQRRIQQEHLNGEEQLQSWLIAQVQRHLADKGKVIIGWDEIMGLKGDSWGLETAINDRNPLLGDDAVVMSWRGLKPGLEVARADRKVIMCPTEFCYLDYYQGDPRYQPTAIGGMITLRKAYDFDPAPMGTNLHVEANILGGQCNLWTEFINTPQHAEYMLLPRMLAISECLWSPQAKKDWYHFRRKVEEQKERLGNMGYGYCEGSFTPQFTAHLVNDDTMNIAITTEVPNTYIFYTTDRSTPTRESAIYLGPINLARGTHIKLLPVYKDKERDSVYEYVIK